MEQRRDIIEFIKVQEQQKLQKTKLERAEAGFIQIQSSQAAIISELDSLEAELDQLLGTASSHDEGLTNDPDTNRPNDYDATKDAPYWDMIALSRQMHLCNQQTDNMAERFYQKAEADAKRLKEQEVKQSLSDETNIGGKVWRDLKHDAMKPDYESQSWYTALTPAGKQLLDRCRDAQRQQGDMKYLRFEPFKTFQSNIALGQSTLQNYFNQLREMETEFENQAT